MHFGFRHTAYTINNIADGYHISNSYIKCWDHTFGYKNKKRVPITNIGLHAVDTGCTLTLTSLIKACYKPALIYPQPSPSFKTISCMPSATVCTPGNNSAL